MSWNQTATFSKDVTGNQAGLSNYKNWGLYTCTYLTSSVTENFSPSNVKLSGTNIPETVCNRYGTITLPRTGKNVDVIIWEPLANTLQNNHPEFALSANGSGGSRVVQLNWFNYLNAVGLGSVARNGSYNYNLLNSTISSARGNLLTEHHATMVGGILAGNTQGWARESSVYYLDAAYGGVLPAINLTPTSNGEIRPVLVVNGRTDQWWLTTCVKLICAFHCTKSLVPNDDGVLVRKPTIVNVSFGLEDYYLFDDLTPPGGSVIFNYRGVDHTINDNFNTTNPGTSAAFLSSLYVRGFGYGAVGLPAGSSTTNHVITIPFESDIVNFEVEKAAAAGVVFVCAAVNYPFKVDLPGKKDWNNNFVQRDNLNRTTRPFYYNRGGTPASAKSSIVVGGIDIACIPYQFAQWVPDLSGNSPTNKRGWIYNPTGKKVYEKQITSASGPGITVWAPGDFQVTSISNKNYSFTNGVTTLSANDVRNNIYKIGWTPKGNSFACPHVAGILALYAEELLNKKTPVTLNTDSAKSYIKANSVKKLIKDYPETSSNLNVKLVVEKIPGVVIPWAVPGVKWLWAQLSLMGNKNGIIKVKLVQPKKVKARTVKEMPTTAGIEGTVRSSQWPPYRS